MPCGVLVWRLDQIKDESKLRLTFFNEKASDYTGITPTNQNQTIGRVLDLSASEKLLNLSKQVLLAQKDLTLEEFKIKDSYGNTNIYKLHVYPLNSEYVAVYLYKFNSDKSSVFDLPRSPLSNLISKLETYKIASNEE